MKPSTLASLSLVLLVSTLGTMSSGSSEYGLSSHFYCDRPGQECKNGGDCYGSGGCYCPDSDLGEFIGYDCGINVTGFPDTGVEYEGCPCKQGSCYRGADGDTLYCLCPPEYFGEDCSANRVKVECKWDSMWMYFQPIQPFYGIVYVGNDPHDYSCRFHDYYEDSLYSYQRIRSYDYDERYCNLTVTNQADGSNRSYTNQLTIQYNQEYQSGLDLVIDVTCHFLENGTLAFEQVLGVTRGEENVGNGNPVESAYFPVQLEIRFAAAPDPLQEPVYIGRELDLVIYLTSTQLYSTIVVESCSFSDSVGRRVVEMITDGCPSYSSIGTDFGGPRSMTSGSPGVLYAFRAMRFGTDPVVKVSCRVKVCRDDNMSDCQQPNCDDVRRNKRSIGEEGMKTLRREKRQAKDQENEGTISQSFQVLDPFVENGKVSKVTADQCMGDPIVKTIGVSLVVTLVVLAVLCIVLALCVCRLKFARRDMALKLMYSQGKAYGTGVYNDGFDAAAGGDLKTQKGI